MSILTRDTPTDGVSGHQLRVMVDEYVVYSAHRVELCADEILAEATDNEIRKNALLLKINGISACFQAASRKKPQGAFLDLSVLNRQTLLLLESPAGQQLFGPWQPRVIREYNSFDKRLLDINQVVTSEFGLGDDFVDKFAADFPLTSLYFDREPIATRYIEKVKTPSKELFQVVANLDGNIDELKKLSVLYAEHLPKKARWEAELFLIDTLQLAAVQRSLQNLEIAAAAVSSIADTTQLIPHIIERERRILTELVTDERQETLRTLEQMRQETVFQLSEERSVVLAAISQEREAVLASLRQERFAVTRELNVELSRALDATESITRRRIDELADNAPGLIDHFFWRAAQIGLACGVLVSLLAWFFSRRTVLNRQPSRVPFDSDGTGGSQFSVVYTDEANRAA